MHSYNRGRHKHWVGGGGGAAAGGDTNRWEKSVGARGGGGGHLPRTELYLRITYQSLTVRLLNCSAAYYVSPIDSPLSLLNQ